MNDIGVFAKNLKLIRKKRGLTQKELGEKIGLTSQSIINYEKGINFPTGNRLQKLLEVLEVTSEQLLGSEGVRFDSAKQMEKFITMKVRLHMELHDDSKSMEKKRAALLKILSIDEKSNDELINLCELFIEDKIKFAQGQFEKDLRMFLEKQEPHEEMMKEEEI